MVSAWLGSPMTACQSVTGNWLAMWVEARSARSSTTSVRSRRDCCAGRWRTARLPRRSGHDRAGSLSLAFLDFPVQHLQCVLLTGSEGERPAGRSPAVHRRRGYAEQAGELGDRESAPAAQLRHPAARRLEPGRRGAGPTRPPAAGPAASGGLLPSGRRAAVRRVEIDAEDVREIAGEDVVPRRGVRQRHVADDQVIGVDVPQAEEQLGTVVEPAADTVEHGGRVLAHHRPVGTVASEGNLAGFREQAAVGIGDDAQDVIGQPPLEQLAAGSDPARALGPDGLPGDLPELPDAHDDVKHVEERLAAPREVGVEAQVAGRQLRPGLEREMALDFLSQLGSSAGMHAPGAGSPGARYGSPMGAAAGSIGLAAGMGGPAGGGMGLAADPMNGMAGPAGGLFDQGLRSMGLGGENLLTSSSIALTRETRLGGILSFWSRGARSSFAGREEALSLGGDVRTTMFGADYAKGPLVTGLSLSNSRGLGDYAGVTGGQVASAVTGLYPWLGYKLSDRVSVWGVTGYGKGALTLTPGEGAALTSGLSMAMGAAGTRGALVTNGTSGFELAFKADALWVGTSIDGVEGPGGNLTATAAAVTRFRTGLEAARGYALAGRLSLRPSVEVGLRHDGGDAETGAGLDVGGGLVVSDTSTGLAVDLRVRMLVMHQADGFRERGMALSLSYNPTPSTPLGFTARVAPSWGGEATSGAEAMWGRETMAGMVNGGLASGNRLDGEVGYGLPVGSRFVGTPRAGVSTWSTDGTTGSATASGCSTGSV